MSEKLISVIIPIYKVEQYLDKCVESIVNQTYKKLEIILVDDGSPDNCPKMCDVWAKNDERVKVIHKENGGLSDARNAGIDVCKGDYIMFVDSDDSIHLQTCEILLKNIIDNNADIAMSSFQKVNSLDSILLKNYNIDNVKCKVYENDECMAHLFKNKIPTTSVAWSKLYKKEIFNDLRFDKGKIHEDEFIIHKTLDKCDSITYVDLPLYNYLQRGDSITGTFTEKRLVRLEALENRIDYLSKYRPKFKRKAIMQYLNASMKMYYKAKISNLDISITDGIKDKMLNYYKKGYKSFKLKMFFLFPGLLDFFVNIYVKLKKK